MVELMRQGASPEEAGLEVLRRVTRQAQRAAAWQPGMVDDQGRPSFGLHLYAMSLEGPTAGVNLRGGGRYAVADKDKGPLLEELVALHPQSDPEPSATCRCRRGRGESLQGSV